MRKIRIAQIGTSCNNHGTSIWNSLKKQSDIFEIYGYAMPENEKEKFPECMEAFKDYPELTIDEIMQNPEIEAVVIETEEIYLTKYALLAAEHNKHIHMEKPGSAVLPDFEKLIETVTKNKFCGIVFKVYIIKTIYQLILVYASCETMPRFEMRECIGTVKELENVNINREDITDVIITHSHHNHIECFKYFENAVIHIQKDEYTIGKNIYRKTLM